MSEHGRAAAPVLQRAWRLAAESGAPALVLGAQGGTAPEIRWVNRPLTDLLGRHPDELVGLALSDLADGPDAAWSQPAMIALGAVTGQREGRVQRLDGSTVRVQICTQPLTATRADGWLVTVHPIDDADMAAARLRDAEHRFAALAECAPVGIVLSEVGLRLGYVNERFARITGVQRHLLLGTGWLDRIVAEDLPPVYEAAEAVLTGATRELTVRLVTDHDVQRYLHLRLAPTTTPARAAGFIATAEDVTQRRAWEEKITYQAQHDPLTGLVNRRRLVEVLTELLDSKRLIDRQFALLFIDLDGFKEVNDTHGHEAGDRVLVEVARRMRRSARELDLIARVAGDEFVVLLRNAVNDEDAQVAAQRQIDTLSAPYRLARLTLRLSASVGIAVPLATDTPESLLRAADRVMYEAKAAGGGAFRVAGDDRSPLPVPSQGRAGGAA